MKKPKVKRSKNAKKKSAKVANKPATSSETEAVQETVKTVQATVKTDASKKGAQGEAYKKLAGTITKRTASGVGATLVYGWRFTRNFVANIWSLDQTHRPDRRSGLQKGAGALVAVGTMALPFGLARFLSPVEGSTLDLKAADKFKRNLLLRQNRNKRRPPGALADTVSFINSCIGCGLCGEICPPRCIKFHKREGGKNVNTPYIDASERACTLCGKCMEVCPTDALTVTARKKVDMGVAQIDRSACFPWVDRGICGACVAACPIGKEAISFKSWNQYQPMVHEACVGCGLCVEVCPHPSTPIWIVDRALGRVASRA